MVDGPWSQSENQQETAEGVVYPTG